MPMNAWNSFRAADSFKRHYNAFIKGELRLPTGRSASLLDVGSFPWMSYFDETCVALHMVLSDSRIASLRTRRGPRRLRLSQQPQGWRLSLSPGAARRSVVPIKRRDVEAARDGEVSRHAEAVIASYVTLPSP